MSNFQIATYINIIVIQTNNTMINKIITELYKKNIPMKVYNKLKRNLPYIEDVEDYQQEMYLILLEYTEAKIIDLYEQGRLDDYFARICINQLVNPNSNLNKLLQTNKHKTDIEEYEATHGEFDSEHNTESEIAFSTI